MEDLLDFLGSSSSVSQQNSLSDFLYVNEMLSLDDASQCSNGTCSATSCDSGATQYYMVPVTDGEQKGVRQDSHYLELLKLKEEELSIKKKE